MLQFICISDFAYTVMPDPLSKLSSEHRIWYFHELSGPSDVHQLFDVGPLRRAQLAAHGIVLPPLPPPDLPPLPQWQAAGNNHNVHNQNEPDPEINPNEGDLEIDPNEPDPETNPNESSQRPRVLVIVLHM